MCVLGVILYFALLVKYTYVVKNAILGVNDEVLIFVLPSDLSGRNGGPEGLRSTG